MSEQRQTRAVIDAEDRGSRGLWIRSHSDGLIFHQNRKNGGQKLVIGSKCYIKLQLKRKKSRPNRILEAWHTQKVPSCLRVLDNDVINCAPASWQPQEKKGGGGMNVTPSGCSIYCSSEPNPAGSVYHSGFMFTVVAPISWCLSCCQYFWCLKSGRKHAGGCRKPSDRS